MNIIICDDEQIFLDQVKKEVEDFFGKLDCNCITYKDGRDVVAAYSKDVTWDAVFLDIEMAHLDGMSTAKKLRDMGLEAPILFFTSHTEMAMDGYEVAAFRFLAKPLQKEKIKRALLDLKEELFQKKKIIIHHEGEDIVLFVEDIIYVEAMNNSVSIVLQDTEYTVRKKISDIEKELSDITDVFYRIHRGYLVNLGHVKKHHVKEITVTGGKELPVSRSLVNDFKEKLFAYIRSSAV